MLRTIGDSQAYIWKAKHVRAISTDLEKAEKGKGTQYSGELMEFLNKKFVLSFIILSSTILGKEKDNTKNCTWVRRLESEVSRAGKPGTPGKGVRQGYCLFPTLFSICLEEILDKCLDDTKGISLVGMSFPIDMIMSAERE